MSTGFEKFCSQRFLPHLTVSARRNYGHNVSLQDVPNWRHHPTKASVVETWSGMFAVYADDERMDTGVCPIDHTKMDAATIAEWKKRGHQSTTEAPAASNATNTVSTSGNTSKSESKSPIDHNNMDSKTLESWNKLGTQHHHKQHEFQPSAAEVTTPSKASACPIDHRNMDSKTLEAWQNKMSHISQHQHQHPPTQPPDAPRGDQNEPPNEPDRELNFMARAHDSSNLPKIDASAHNDINK